MQAVRASGLDKKVSIIASVLLLQSPEQAELLRKMPTGKAISDVMVDRLRQPTNGTSAGLSICAEQLPPSKASPACAASIC